MAQLTPTARPKIACAIALGTATLLGGCNTTPRENYITQRAIVHASNVGTGERLPSDPVLVQSSRLDFIRR